MMLIISLRMNGDRYNRRGDPLMVSRVKLEKLVDICRQWAESFPQSGLDIDSNSESTNGKAYVLID